MVSNQSGVLSMVKRMNDNGGLSETAMCLAEAQAKDYDMLIADNKKIKEDVARIKEEQVKQSSSINSLDEKMDLILGHFNLQEEIKRQAQNNRFEIIKQVVSSPYFYVIIGIIILCTFLMAGVDVSKVGEVVKIEGVR